jgi:hypothetical protein
MQTSVRHTSYSQLSEKVDVHRHGFDFAIVHTFSKVHTQQEGLKLNVTHQHMICADDVNIRVQTYVYILQMKTQNLH